MFIEGSSAAPTISFTEDAPRLQGISSSEITIINFNRGWIALFGGWPTSAGTLLHDKTTQPGNVPLDILPQHDDQRLDYLYPWRSALYWRSSKSAIGRVSHSMYESRGGRRSLKENFVNDTTMHSALLLPNSQVLITLVWSSSLSDHTPLAEKPLSTQYLRHRLKQWAVEQWSISW